MNNNPIFSSAGIWAPIDASNLTASTNGAIIGFSSLIKLSTSGQYGIVLNGWGWQGGFGGSQSPVKVNMAILSQDSSGGLSLNTQNYVADPSNNGSGSVLVADFNSDGLDDIFLVAHNESPFKAMPSTLYWGSTNGRFEKVTVNDLVMAHDASLNWVGGAPVVLATTFQPGQYSSFYLFNGSEVSVLEISGLKAISGQSGRVFYNEAINDYQLIRGDVLYGYSQQTQKSELQNIDIYRFDATRMDIVSSTPTQSIIPYLSTLSQYENFPSTIGGEGKTHNYRLWTDDINNDGYTDILVAQSMWSQSQDFPSALQILLNDQRGEFLDVTAQLNSEMSLNVGSLDYHPTFIDLDHSGINSYLFSSGAFGLSRQSNYVLLNDGTGQLFTAIHDQFSELTPQVFSFLNQAYSNNFSVNTNLAPKFIAVPQADGTLNFVAEVSGSVRLNNGVWQNQYAFVNVPLQYNITTDFNQNITITDRNQSMLIRTWAGDDQFFDNGANSGAAHIDGGLGKDIATYSGKYSQYQVSGLTDNSFEVQSKVVGSNIPAVDDTLQNIERLQFSDISLALDVGPAQNAGSVYMLYKAAFNRPSDAGGMGYWIAQKDGGANIVTTIAQGFVDSPEFIAKYGANPSNASYVNNLYLNVLGRAGEAEGVAYWNTEMNAGRVSKAQALVAFATLPEGAGIVAPLIANGIQYQEWLG